MTHGPGLNGHTTCQGGEAEGFRRDQNIQKDMQCVDRTGVMKCFLSDVESSWAFKDKRTLDMESYLGEVSKVIL